MLLLLFTPFRSPSGSVGAVAALVGSTGAAAATTGSVGATFVVVGSSGAQAGG